MTHVRTSKNSSTAAEGKKDSKPQPKQKVSKKLQSSTPLTSSSTRSSSPSPSPSPSSPPPLTRKQKRQALLAQGLADELAKIVLPTESDFDHSNCTYDYNFSDSESDDDLPSILSNLSMSSTRLLVCSIGNPAPYLNTLHSAGHTVLSLLAPALQNPAFTKSRAHGNGLLSSGPVYTLWKSSSLMNISGSGVLAAWTQFKRESGGSSSECRLIVVHDELELLTGRINVKAGSSSPKGHNGLKSIRDTLRGQEYTRIGVGIGRPESRDANVVANYVLRKMNGEEKRKIEGCVGKVVEELAKLGAE